MFLTSSWTLDTIIIITILLYLFYKYMTRNFDYWKNQGVFYFKPIPFFGNFYKTFTMKTTLTEEMTKYYNKTDEPYFGAFMFDHPVLVLRSTELIKNILVKDFVYFKDRTMASGQHNKMISNWLLFQKYAVWKPTRSKLSQVLSSGKLKTMSFKLIDLSNLMVDWINKNMDVFEAKSLCRKFTTEMSLRCFFGVDPKCFENEESDFNKINTRNFEFSLRNGLIHGLYIFKPPLVDFLRLNFMRNSDMNFLINAVENSLENRRNDKNRIKGKITDYIDVILEIEENDKREGVTGDSDSGYVLAMANTLQFYLAGEETTSSLLSFTMYEYALNPHTQEKARKEISKVLKKHGKLSYDSVQEMEYLGMCFAETSRKYTNLHVLDRKADMDYKVPGTDFVIKKGTYVYIPTYAVHMDEQYFPEPQKYIPERFLDKDVNNERLCYFPFGAGPRFCIGERFGHLAAKICLANILSKFEIEVCDQTPTVITFEPKSFTLRSKNGLFVRFKPLGENEILY